MSVKADANSFFNAIGSILDKTANQTRISLLELITTDDVLRFRDTCLSFPSLTYVDEKIRHLLQQSEIPCEQGSQRDECAELLLNNYKHLMRQHTTQPDMLIIDKLSDSVRSVSKHTHSYTHTCINMSFQFFALQNYITVSAHVYVAGYFFYRMGVPCPAKNPASPVQRK